VSSVKSRRDFSAGRCFARRYRAKHGHGPSIAELVHAWGVWVITRAGIASLRARRALPPRGVFPRDKWINEQGAPELERRILRFKGCSIEEFGDLSWLQYLAGARKVRGYFLF
jgi:hypothetical protein